MKKVTRIFCAICMMGLLTFVSTSCKKNQENGEMTITVSMPSIENVGDRAYITVGGVFTWHENDFIRVYNLAAEADAIESTTSVFSKIGSNTATTARFRGPSVGAKKAEGYRIFYPINMVVGDEEEGLEIEEVLWNENRQIFKVADHQEFSSYELDDHHYSMVDPAAMPMAQRMNKLTDNATMLHMFGVAAFNINAGDTPGVIVDSVVYEDNGFNITGEVSVKLHKVAVDDETFGPEHNLWNVWDAYQGLTPDYIQNTLAPALDFLGWMPKPNPGNKITMNCIHENADGVEEGVVLGLAPYGTNFNFILRPLAVSEGFTLTVYIHDAAPVVLTDAQFSYGGMGANANWKVMPATRKTYTKASPLF